MNMPQKWGYEVPPPSATVFNPGLLTIGSDEARGKWASFNYSAHASPSLAR